MNIPKPYIKKLQNRKKCLKCGGTKTIYNDSWQPARSFPCNFCQGTGLEPITLIFPAKEAKDWKVGQEITLCGCGVSIGNNQYSCDCEEKDFIKFKILSLEKKIFDEEYVIIWCDLWGTKTFNDVEKVFGKIKDGEEIVLVRC